MPNAATTPRIVMWSGVTRAGMRRAIQSRTRASGAASRKVFWRAVMTELLVDRRSTRHTRCRTRGYGGRAAPMGAGRRPSAFEDGAVLDLALPFAFGGHGHAPADDDVTAEGHIPLDGEPLAVDQRRRG